MRFGRRRRIHEGDTYTINEDVELDQPEPNPEQPIEIQGEPWGWTKGPPYPVGWRMDGKYDGTE